MMACSPHGLPGPDDDLLLPPQAAIRVPHLERVPPRWHRRQPEPKEVYFREIEAAGFAPVEAKWGRHCRSAAGGG